jgi:hypothetical protein
VLTEFGEVYGDVFGMRPPIDGLMETVNGYETVFCRFIVSTRISL